MKRRSKTVLLILGIVVASVLAFILVPVVVFPGDFGLLKTYSR